MRTNLLVVLASTKWYTLFTQEDNRLINDAMLNNRQLSKIRRGTDTKQKNFGRKMMSTDRRIKYTKMVLRQALLEILQEKSIDQVTVKEICERADVNRSTFYVHYGSPQELLGSIQQQMYEEIYKRKKDFTNMKAYMADMCEILYDNRELFQVLLKSGNVETMFAITDIWKDDLRRAYADIDIQMADIDSAHLFITCGAMAVVGSWLLGHISMSKDKVVDVVYSLTMNSLRTFSKKEE